MFYGHKVENLIQRALTEGESSPGKVRDLNENGVPGIFNGRTEQALQDFLSALRWSGSDVELRAQCLVNIGDWTRRIAGDLPAAFRIFAQVDELPISLVTRSRLRSMQAMAWRYRAERGESDPEGIAKCISCLKEAIALAQQASITEDPSAALAAESLAVHRLGGTASIKEWWVTQERQEWLELMEQLLPRLDLSSPERARLNRTKGLIIGEERPLEGAAIVEQSARDIASSSRLDATGYRIDAGHLYFQGSELVRAKECWRWAEDQRDFLEQYGAGAAPMLQRLDALKAELE